MIKFSEDFECEQDPHQWVLYEWYIGKAKDGKEPKRQCKTTYHGSLYQVCDTVIDRQAGKCTSMLELMNMLKLATAYELVRVIDLPDTLKLNKRID